jgi:prepilin-type N-terminal cleavage/methylation domain-containing protein
MMTRALRVRDHRGFTTLEMLLAMAVLGIILTVAAALLQSNQRATDAQQARTGSLEDARMAASRMAETINQAAYIFPAGVRIQVTGGMVGRDGTNGVTTGGDALALLLPDGSSGTLRLYRGVIYYLADRTKFLDVLPDLPSSRIAQSVLVEARSSTTISWAQNQSGPPSPLWNVKMDEGVLVDGMVDDGSSSTNNANLMASASFSPSAGIDSVFSGGIREKENSGKPQPKISDTDALILGIGFRLSVRVSAVGQAGTTTPSTIISGLGTARNVPRR